MIEQHRHARHARDLNNQALDHVKDGDYRAAWDASQESVSLYRELTARAPDEYFPRLAAALGNSAAIAAQLGDLPRAVDLLEEEAELLRSGAGSDPEAT